MNQQATIKLTDDSWRSKRYRLETSDGRWLNFTLWDDRRSLTSFGGSVWPGELPSIFEHVGPDRDAITYRSGPWVREGVTLPAAVGEEVTA